MREGGGGGGDTRYTSYNCTNNILGMLMLDELCYKCTNNILGMMMLDEPWMDAAKAMVFPSAVQKL
jgi:hypothetical protein